MLYQKFTPQVELKPFVECYFIWQSTEAINGSLVVESPPSGFCSIVFNSGDPYSLQNKKYDNLVVPQQFISGQSIYSYRLLLHGIISMAGIVFKPAALASLFNLPVYEYTEERIPLNQVFSIGYVDTYINEILNAANANDKVKVLEKFVFDKYNEHRPKPDGIDYAANLIIDKNGMVEISDILKKVFMSRRSFERRFFKKVGLSPKFYARLRRMSFIMNQIAGKKKVDWVKLFSQCDFYDQSHFIKDFIEFVGRTPQNYLEDNIELANIIEKPITKNISY